MGWGSSPPMLEAGEGWCQNLGKSGVRGRTGRRKRTSCISSVCFLGTPQLGLAAEGREGLKGPELEKQGQTAYPRQVSGFQNRRKSATVPENKF